MDYSWLQPENYPWLQPRFKRVHGLFRLISIPDFKIITIQDGYNYGFGKDGPQIDSVFIEDSGRYRVKFFSYVLVYHKNQFLFHHYDIFAKRIDDD